MQQVTINQTDMNQKPIKKQKKNIIIEWKRRGIERKIGIDFDLIRLYFTVRILSYVCTEMEINEKLDYSNNFVGKNSHEI